MSATPTRLFDFIAARNERAPDGVMLAGKEGGSWRTYSTQECWKMAQGLAAGLHRLGVSTDVSSEATQEKIVLISPNRPEWLITDLGVQMAGAILTPIYPTVAPSDLAFILKDAGVRIVVLADSAMYARFGEVLREAEGVEHVFSFDEVQDAKLWKSLIAEGAAAPSTDAITGDTVATIIYTSGTTGTPKGVMLTHRNVVSNVLDTRCIFSFAESGGKALSFLPLNHIFERMVSYVYLNADLAIWYAESMETIGDNLREVQPLVFTTVPRLLEKVYERILGKGMELKGIKRALFFWALGLAKKYDNAKSNGAWYDMQLALANKLIFSKWRAALGGNVKAIVSGSAALQERLIRIFSAAGIVIMEGYGLTETSPVISVNRFESDGRRIGSIGPLIDNVEVKLGEDGEIIARGPNVMKGYYNRPDMTAEVLDKDGWFSTGDIGMWVEDRFLKITDRKKEIFKTSGGKYVAPQPIENKLRESPYIEQAMVVGAGQKFAGALIVPAFAAVRKWLKDAGKDAPSSNEELAKLPEVRDLIRKQVDRANSGFGQVEQVKKFALLPNEWTIDTGLLTPKLSMKRKAIEAACAKELAELYD